MLQKLGPLGVLGVVLLLAGIGVTAYANPVVGAGIALIVAGMGLLVKRGVDQVMGLFGM
ncbi:MAG: DUF7470 family protein [Halobacteriota archaeon]|uniref:DUF7470 family protein n=1 Tax=Halanaeroarchaeum sp. HSR-CO TaxID=2866382 RepID=UPI00217DF8C2|nr:hypothetical protein [Halanaeroarchaeum sp. HSR-CO]UWG48963.1 putative membrane protein [Halanaeroarchaeum sp. HSR-CO]